MAVSFSRRLLKVTSEVVGNSERAAIRMRPGPATVPDSEAIVTL